MIDLSHPIVDGMMVYPGDPGVSVRPGLTLERDGVAVASLALGSHTGTHIDAPSHTVAGGATLDATPLEQLSDEALIIDAASRARDRRPLGVADLGIEGLDAVPRIVFVRTGWDRCFGEARYLDHPWLAPEVAERLLALGMRVLGVDALSPDPTASATGETPEGSDAPAGSEGEAETGSEALTGSQAGARAEFVTPGRAGAASGAATPADPGYADPGPEGSGGTGGTGGTSDESGFPVHAAVLGAGGLIVENLRGLDRVGRYARVGIFPLPLAGVDGAPARVIAWSSGEAPEE